MRYAKVTLIMFLSTVLLSGTVFAQPQSNALKKQQANTDLDNMAKEIATLLQHPGFRGFLRSEIARSKNSESILELDKFLERSSKQKGMPPGLAKVKDFAGKAHGRLKASGLTALEGYDLYIPVAAHRAKWRGGKDFLVAFAPVDDEKDIKQIVAYSVNDGKRVILDPNKAPETVVLALVPEEHENHVVDNVVVDKGPMPSANQKPDVIGENPPDRPVKQDKGKSYVGWHYIYLYDDHEPWTRGAAEIKMLFGIRQGNSCVEYYTPLPWVDHDYNWYSIAGYTYDAYWSPKKHYYDSYYSPRMVVKIYEDDGGSRKTIVAGLYEGINCDWSIYDGDDYVGGAYQYLTNFPYNYDYGHRFGDAFVYWHKIP